MKVRFAKVDGVVNATVKTVATSAARRSEMEVDELLALGLCEPLGRKAGFERRLVGESFLLSFKIPMQAKLFRDCMPQAFIF